MSNKRSDKDKSEFFGDHLEVKPSFMQKPKSLEEVMADAFTTRVVNNSPVEPNAAKEPFSTKAPYSTVEQSQITIQNNQYHSTFTVEPESLVDHQSTVEQHSTVGEKTPERLRDEVNRLKKNCTETWKKVDFDEEYENYWLAYSHAWHWIEDNIISNLDKDCKLTLRRCYRKAYGKLNSNGKFFIGQTALAKEVGLSKRKIQDILEIFNQVGWVIKTAHYNNGSQKGTEYEMRLPLSAAKYFENNEKANKKP